MTTDFIEGFISGAFLVAFWGIYFPRTKIFKAFVKGFKS